MQVEGVEVGHADGVVQNLRQGVGFGRTVGETADPAFSGVRRRLDPPGGRATIDQAIDTNPIQPALHVGGIDAVLAQIVP